LLKARDIRDRHLEPGSGQQASGPHHTRVILARGGEAVDEHERGSRSHSAHPVAVGRPGVERQRLAAWLGAQRAEGRRAPVRQEFDQERPGQDQRLTGRGGRNDDEEGEDEEEEPS
jgi:hypothetical protein